MKVSSDRSTRAEINLCNLVNNFDEIRRITPPNAEIMAIVKADGYGHGAIQVAKVAASKGIRHFGVAILEEAEILRNNGFDSEILVLGPLPPWQYEKAISLGVSVVATDADALKELSAAACRVGISAKVHIKIDTGMSRVGFYWSDAADRLMPAANLPGLDLAGILTHLATSDESDKSFAWAQFSRFMDVLEKLEKLGLSFRYRHCANSGAILDIPEMALDLVRPGIILYGLYPSDEVSHRAKLLPLMKLISKVSQVKEVPPGTPVSYGSTYVTKGRETLATIPVGYADGYSRLLAGKAEVLIGGRRCKVVGRVCMDQCVASVPAEISGDVRVGDEVVLIGGQGDEFIAMEEIAAHMGTINYEIACMVSSRVPRIYTGVMPR